MTLLVSKTKLTLASLLTVLAADNSHANSAHIVKTEVVTHSLELGGAYTQAKAASLSRWLEMEIHAFCTVKYGEKQLKKASLDTCQNGTTKSLEPQQTSISAAQLKASDADTAILLLAQAKAELKNNQQGFQKALRMMYSLYAEHSQRTNFLFPGAAPEKTTVAGIFKAFNKFFLTHIREGIVEIEISSKPSSVDVRPQNPTWYSKDEKSAAGQSAQARWSTLENQMIKLVAEKKGANYNFKSSTRILMYKKTKESASSPKVDAKDLYGIDWKVKWGDEIQSEAIANRLYVGAGGRYNDLVYVKGPDFENDNGMILLIDSEAAEPEEICDGAKITDVHSLLGCLRNSKYQSNISTFVSSFGKLSDAANSSLLARVKNTAEQMGKTIKGTESFIIFRESSVEFSGEEAFTKVGPVSLSANYNDNALRGVTLFNLWIANRDVKDDNGRGILMKNSKGHLEYLESIHDQGYSLGSTKAGGEVGKFADTFLSVVGNKISVNEPLLYLPDIYAETTYSDLTWMGGQILELSETDLRWAVDQSNWPDFMKVALMRKLISRQLNIAQVLNFPKEATRLKALLEKYSQDYKVTLAKKGDNVRLTGQFGATVVESVYADPSAVKALSPVLAKFPEISLTETVLKRGLLSACTPQGNPLQDTLIRLVNPSGFYHRITRLTDHLPTEEQLGCQLREPNKGDTGKYLLAR